MPKREIPSPDRLRQLLRYEPETGKLFWRMRGDVPGWWNTRFAGTEGFTFHNGNGYPRGRIDYAYYYAHRVIFAIMTGEWPEHQVDHIDGDVSNNKWSNLRHATSSQNSMNMKKHIDGSAPYKGITWSRQHKMWAARICRGGVHKHIGLFNDPREAHEAYINAARVLHGEFARSS